MSFWINDRAGVAFEFNEAGLCKWDPSSSSFNIPMNSDESRGKMFGSRRVSESEAEAFIRSHATP